MKIGTWLRLMICFVFLGACSRNPLGEDIKQPILNLAFTLTQSCTNIINQDVTYNCQINTSEVVSSVVYSVGAGTTCAWATLNTTTGVVSGTPNDNQVGSCQFVVNASNQFRTAPAYTYTINVNNVAPTLTIADAAPIVQDTPSSVIRADADVQASEEGFGLYSFAHAATTAPRCSDNANVLSIDANTGAVTYEPATAYSGTCNIRVVFNDGNGLPSSTVFDEFAIQVLDINDAPVLSSIGNQTTTEDIPIVINFTITDDQVLSCTGSMTANSSNAALVPVGNVVFGGVAPNCTATVTPTLNNSGTTNLTFTVTDTGIPVMTDFETFVLTVNNVNDAPILGAIGNRSTNEDTPLLINFTITDTDSILSCTGSMSVASSDTAVVPVANVVFGGTIPNCTATVTPAFNANGFSNLTFTVSDGGAPVQTDFETITFTVTPVNDAPILGAVGPRSTNEDTPLVINFTANDVDSTLTCAGSITAASTNTAVVPVANIVFGGVIPNCTATVTPAANSTGVTNLTFTLADSGVPILTDFETFSLTVNPVNDAPVLSPIGPRNTNEDTPLVINFTINDLDSTLTCAGSMAAVSTNAALVPAAQVVFSGTAPNCVATVTPLADAFGLTDLTFTVTDSGTPILSDFETFTLTVNSVNDAPILNPVGNRITSEDTPLVINFVINDVDQALNCVTSMSVSSSNTGLVPIANVVFGGLAPNCTATVTPVADTNGVTNLTFTVTDTGVPILTDFETFSFTVNPVNDAPVLSAIGNQIVEENDVLVVNFTVSDVDNVLSCSSLNLSATSSNVTLMPVANIVFGGAVPNCTATFTPAATQFGVSNISITLNDNGTPNLQDVENFTVTVTPFNDPPVLSAIGNRTTNEDVPLMINFTITDIDDTLNCATSMSVTSSNTGLIPIANVVFGGVAPNCTATVTPVADANGVSNLTFTVSDTGVPVKTDFETFSFTVTAVNDAPILGVIGPRTTNEDTPLVINFTINDVDHVLSCTGSMSVASANTALIPVANVVFSGVAPNCTATVTPVANATGAAGLTFTVTDGGAPIETDFEAFAVTVSPVNDPPVLSAIGPQTTNEDTPRVINFTITDVDHTLDCSASMSVASSNVSLIPVANVVFSGAVPNCVATITPVANASGVSNLTFTVSDSGAPVLTDFETFSLTVNNINDPPVLDPIGNRTTNEDTPLVINFVINDVDQVLTCTGSMTAASSNVGVIPVGNIVFGGVAPNCTATVTPVANVSGVSNLTFTVTDTGTPIQTDFETFSFTVNSVNDAPILSAIGGRVTNEDVPLVINFTITDVDDTLNCATSMTAASTNTVLIPIANIVFGGVAPNCTATVTPFAGASGVSNLTFTVTDTGTPVLNDFETFIFTVNDVNDPPVLSAIGPQTTNEDVPLVINFNITDADHTLNCTTSMSAASTNVGLVPVANIVFSGVAPNCVATVTPVADANGFSNLTFTVADTGTPVQTDFETFGLTVNAINDAPILSAIGSRTTNEDTPLVINFTINDVDNTMNCSSSMSVASTNVGLIPIANIVFGGVAPNCNATVTPVAGASGVSNLTFTVTDTGTPVQTDFETFSFTVNSVNDAPILSAIGNRTTNEDTPLVINFSITDVDNTLDCTTSMSAASTNTGLVPIANIVFSGTVPNCNATVTPVADGSGVVNLTFTVSDTGTPVQTDFETFSFTVTAVNDAPILGAIGNRTINEDNALVINYTINDIDSPMNCVTSMSMSTSTPALIQASSVVFSGVAPNCTATITPELNQNGSVNLTIRVSDGQPLNDDETFTVTINPVNDAPTISNVVDQSINEDTILGPIGFTISDVDTILLCTSANVTATSSNTALVSNGSIVIGGTYPNCTVTATPQTNQTGTTTITLTVNDNESPNLQDADTFVVTVNAVNDVPTISTVANQTINEETSTGPLNFTIGDTETGGALTCTGSVVAVSSNTTVIPNSSITLGGAAPNCTVTVAPPVNQFGGPVTITLTVTDSGTPLPTQSANSTFTVTVININDPPTISNQIDDDTDEDVPYVINFLITDSDNTLNCATSMTAGSSNSTVVPVANIVFSGTAPNCTATITPGANQSGVSTITLTVSDGTLTAADSFVLTVNDIDDTPVISAIADFSRPEDNSAVATQISSGFALNFTITDADSVLTCAGSMSATSSNPALVPVANIVFSGAAPNCTATITSVNNAFGSTNIIFTVTDGVTSALEPFTMTYTPVADNPTITGIANQTTNEDTPFVVNFMIDDVDSTLACTLGPPPTGFLLRQSLNAVMIPVTNIVFGGTAPNCTATITPALNQSGTGDIFIRVNDDAAPPNISVSFNVTVIPVNDNPTISSISNTSFAAGVPTGINFTINDVDSTLNCASSMSATSSNQAVVPNANIVFSGTAPNCTATVTAITTGSTTITYTVSDGSGGTANTSNNVSALNAGSEVISQSYSTLTVTANSSLNSSKAFVQVNETVSMTVTVRDTNNAVAGSGHWVVIQKTSGTANGALSAVHDNGDGTYTANFTATTAGTARSFQAYINGYPVTSTMPQITVSAVGPNCLSYRNVGSSISGVYSLDIDGDAGPQSPFTAYCDMATQGGGWTLAAVPRRGIAPFSETAGLLSPHMIDQARQANIWSSSSVFEFTQIRLTSDASAVQHSTARFAQTQSLSRLLSTITTYSPQNVIAGGATANAQVSSSIGSTCFVFRGKSANVGPWNDAADYMFMGFHGGAGCSVPLNLGNNWDRTNVSAQWLISGYDGLDSATGPEQNNNQVGQNMNGLDWSSQDAPTLIWFK